MTFHEPIGRAEGSQILGWHEVGLSNRDMRDLMKADHYPYPVRSMDGIRDFLGRYGRVPHPSQRGPKSEGRDLWCESDKHPEVTVRRRFKHNDCPKCKVLRAAERRAETRQELADKIEVLRGMGGLAAEIGEWIDENVRVA